VALYRLARVDVPLLVARSGSTGGHSNPFADWESVAPNYFLTMGIPLAKGRGFSDDDRRGQPYRVIVTRHLLAWPGPTGTRSAATIIIGVPHTVVGVVADTRFRDLLTTAPTIYGALAQTDSTRQLCQSMLPFALYYSRSGDEDRQAHRHRTCAGCDDLPDHVDARCGTRATCSPTIHRQPACRLRSSRIGARRNRPLRYDLSARATTHVGIRARMALGAQRAQIGRMILTRTLLLTGVGSQQASAHPWSLPGCSGTAIRREAR